MHEHHREVAIFGSLHGVCTVKGWHQLGGMNAAVFHGQVTFHSWSLSRVPGAGCPTDAAPH